MEPAALFTLAFHVVVITLLVGFVWLIRNHAYQQGAKAGESRLRSELELAEVKVEATSD